MEAANPPAGQPSAPNARDPGWFAALCRRSILIYIPLYIVLSSGVLDSAIAPIASWLGVHLFNLPVSATVARGSDTAFNYLRVLVTAIGAIGCAALWTAMVGRRPVSSTTTDVFRTVARLFLGYIMLRYGWSKLFPLQFPALGPDRLLMSFGDTTPMGLAWTFFGASAAYQAFTGLAELLGAYLVLFRRTALLGALLLAGVLLNVVAINLFHGAPVKIFSAHLLFFSAFIIAPDARRLVRVFLSNDRVPPRVERPFWRGWGRWASAVMVLHVGFLALQTYRNVDRGMTATREYGVLADRHPLAGLYHVASFERNGVYGGALDDSVRWVRVGLNPRSGATVRWADGRAEHMRLVLDDEEGTLLLLARGESESTAAGLRIDRLHADSLRLSGTFRGQSTNTVLVREREPTLFESRGFRWVSNP